MFRHALARLSARRGRALLAAGGIAAAAAMLGAAVTVGYTLATGFDRAAEAAGLPDAVARFDPAAIEALDERTRALPNVEAVAYRLQAAGVQLRAGDRTNDHTKLEGVRPGRRGYAIVAGRDLTGVPGEAVIERGLARSWGLSPGARLDVFDYRGGGASLRVVGVAVAPDDVAFPLVNGPHVYVPYEEVRRLLGAPRGAVSTALLWTRDPAQLDLTLAQARTASYGVTGLQFATRAGIRVLVGQAAGIVIALLVAFSLVALAAAGVMLGASASAEVQRRLRSIGVLRALGASPAGVAGGFALEGAAIALPAGALGLAVGTAAVVGPTGRLLEALNQLAPGWRLAGPLAACLLGIVAVVALAAGWPAWRAASRPPVETLRGADVAGVPRRAPLPGGPVGLGVRLALSRPVRTGATVLVLAASVSVVLLMLTLATLLGRLESDPGVVGKRYALTVAAPAAAARAVARLPGVADAAARYETDAVDSFELGESFRVIAFAGDHTRYEAPALAEGRRLVGDGEAEIGLGLAQALNLHPGGTIAAQLLGGAEVRFRVAGVVRALENEGRLLYVRPRRLLAAEPSLQPAIAVRLADGASRERVVRELASRGLFAEALGGVTAQNGEFLGVLAALLRSVAVVDGLVCLYALVQMLALTAEERRGAVAVVRACGGSRAQVAALLGGSALLVAAVAAPAGIVLERSVVGPGAARLAASYVALPLAAGPEASLLVTGALVLLALAAAGWVARPATREPIVRGLRAE